jgi:hypothetical protein
MTRSSGVTPGGRRGGVGGGGTRCGRRGRGPGRAACRRGCHRAQIGLYGQQGLGRGQLGVEALLGGTDRSLIAGYRGKFAGDRTLAARTTRTESPPTTRGPAPACRTNPGQCPSRHITILDQKGRERAAARVGTSDGTRRPCDPRAVCPGRACTGRWRPSIVSGRTVDPEAEGQLRGAQELAYSKGMLVDDPAFTATPAVIARPASSPRRPHPRAARIAARPRTTGFSRAPMPVTVMRTVCPSSSVNGAGGTRQVPVAKTAPSGWMSARIR